MSMNLSETITCPQCGYKQQYTVWQTMNGSLNPEAKKKLLDGSFFQFQCEKCGYKATTVYDMLYHDMDNNTMVYLVQPDMVEETKFQMEKAQQLTTKRFTNMTGLNILSGKTRNRIVTDANRLREKAIIFDEKLDDRIIEIIKLLCWPEFVKYNQNVQEDHLYFYIDNGVYKLMAMSTPMTCDISKELYNDITKQWEDVLQVVGDDYVIDHNFAGNLFLQMQQLMNDQK